MTSASLLTNTHPALRRSWHPVARSGEVGAQPLKITLLGEDYVLIRSAGTVRAFVDRCPHRGAPLSLGAGECGGIRCGYHGWRYDADGRCVEVPALDDSATLPSKATLSAPAATSERLGLVFVAPEAPLAGLPEVAEDSDERFLSGDLPIFSARASAGLLADNFLDVAHFPFVHTATFGADEARVVGEYDVVPDDDRLGFTATYEHEFANREDPGVASGERPLLQRRRLTYRLVAPFHLTLRIEFLDSDGMNVIGFFLQPETDDRCRIFSTIWRDDLDGDHDRLQEAVDFEVKVVEEDLRIQESFQVLAIPLNLRDEVHTKADRTTVQLRRTLAALVELAAAR